MRRTPLERKTPLRAVAKREEWTRPDPAPMNLNGAATALANRERSLVAALQPRTTVRAIPKAMPKTPPKETGAFPPVVRQAILERDNMGCVRCGTPVDASPDGYSLQHRVARKMGGTSDYLIGRPANGATLCGDGVRGCHGYVEANPVEAERFGYAVQSWADPATVPMYTMRDGWVLLDNKGFKHRAEEPPSGGAHEADSVRRRDTDGTGSASSAHG